MDGIGCLGGNRCQFFSFSILVIVLLIWLLPVLWDRQWGVDWLGIVGSWMWSSNESGKTEVFGSIVICSNSGIGLNMQQSNYSDLNCVHSQFGERGELYYGRWQEHYFYTACKWFPSVKTRNEWVLRVGSTDMRTYVRYNSSKVQTKRESIRTRESQQNH